MVTEPDSTAIKNAIIALLQADTTLWNPPTHTTGDFTQIELGIPDNEVYEGLNYPVCFVTNAEDFEEDKPFGPVVANSLGTSEHIMRFKIIFLAHEETAQQVEIKLDALYKRIKEVLKANNNINGLVTESFPIRGGSFMVGQLRGKPIDGRVILHVCRVHSA